jgi:hypothetical protein
MRRRVSFANRSTSSSVRSSVMGIHIIDEGRESKTPAPHSAILVVVETYLGAKTMVGEVFASVTAFKTMFDMAKALKDISDTTIRNAAVVELQEQILGAQVAQAALMERVSFLEKEVTRFETWEAEKQRYKLERLPPGVFVYSLKQDMAAGEPLHYICQTCCQRGKKSVLHSDEPWQGVHHLTCHECKAILDVGEFRAAPSAGDWRNDTGLD